jgi:rifampin ADP-ribosylating transferase
MYPERVAALALVGSPLSLQGPLPFADEVNALTDPVEGAWVRDSLSWFPLVQAVPTWYMEDRVRDGREDARPRLEGSLGGPVRGHAAH